MGKRKYLDKIERLFDKSPVVSFSSIGRIVKEHKKTEYAKIIINKLLKQGKIHRLAKGYYTKHKDASLSVLCFKPAYLGLQSALSFHSLWAQETIPIIITSRNVRTGIKKVMGANVLIHRVKKEHLFGFDYCDDSGFYLPYSDIEKTLIDLVAFKQNIEHEAVQQIKKRIDKNKLESYLKNYPRKIQEDVEKALKNKKV
jgi:predicted transcriptional regulator of viral defense system